MKSVGSKTGLALAGIVFVGLAGVSAKAGSFQGLGKLPGDSFRSEAWGVSADGSVVVGRSNSASGWEAFRWTAAGDMVSLGYLPGGGSYSWAFGVSADGSVVVGVSHSASGDEAFRWTEAAGMVGLGDLPGGNFYSNALDVSADGSVIVGFSDSALGWAEAFRWTDLNANGSLDPNEKLDYHPEFGLGDLPGGGFYSHAYGVSADGSVVVGWDSSALGTEAFRWIEATGMVGLGDLPGGWFESYARCVSADGSVIVGESDSASGFEAFRWTDLNGNGLVDPNEKLDYHPEFGLGDIPSDEFFIWWPHGVSADGSVVVGRGPEAFIWDAAGGMRNLKDVLEGDFCLDLSGWTLKHATGISDDGSTIAGYGINPSGYKEAWIAILTCDYELAGDMNDDCKFDFCDFAVMAMNWLIDCDQTPPDPACVPK